MVEQEQTLVQCGCRTEPRDHSLSASLSELVIRLISNCQQVEECILSRANCISKPVDLRLLSPAISDVSSPKPQPPWPISPGV